MAVDQVLPGRIQSNTANNSVLSILQHLASHLFKSVFQKYLEKKIVGVIVFDIMNCHNLNNQFTLLKIALILTSTVN